MILKKVKVICESESEFYHFAYELRKYDTNEEFTEKLLKAHFNRAILQIILANKWNK